MATSTELVFEPGAAQETALVRDRRRLIGNVCFGVLDYLVQPLLMVLTARVFVHHMGVARFGTWMLVLAIVGSMGGLCTGFGDAALKYVASMRGRGDMDGVKNTIRAARVLNGVFGTLAMGLFWVLAPWASTRVFHLSSTLQSEFIAAMRIGGFVLLVRSLFFVAIGTLRGFERYRVATKVTASTKVAITLTAVVLAVRGFGLGAMLATTALCEAGALLWLSMEARKVTGPVGWSLDARQWKPLASFGAFSWIQALLGSVFSQADRMLVASMLGPAAVGYYGVCIQAAQPIHGLAASGCNVLFPHLSARIESEGPVGARRTLRRASEWNVLVVLALALPLMLLSRSILIHWMGAEFAQHAWPALTLVALSFATLAFNIPGHYALMALGRIRFLAALNFAGMTVAFGIAALLIPKFGIVGAAVGRLAYGPITWLLYFKINRAFAEGAR